MTKDNNNSSLVSLVFLVASLSWYLTILQSMINDMGYYEIALTSVYCGVVVFLELAFIFTCRKIFPKYSLRISYVLYSLFGALNFLAFSLSFYEGYVGQVSNIRTFILISTWVFLAFLFRLMCINQKLTKMFLVLFTFSICYELSVAVYAEYSQASPSKKEGEISNLEMNAQISNSEDLNAIIFSNKPNIHLISVDALMPEALAKKHLGIVSLQYTDAVKKLNGKMVHNLFADKVPTKRSLNSLLVLNSAPYTNSELASYYAGINNSPVFQIFHNNGYKISTGYSRKEYFGKKGSYLDEEVYTTYDRCEARLPSKYIQHFNLCYLIEYLETITDMKISAKARGRDWIEVLLEGYLNKANDPEQWLTLNYMFNPIGHTHGGFNNTEKENREYKKYVIEQDALLSDILVDFITSIKENDPNSIVFVFGDHGPYISRATNFEDNPEFIIQDQYGIYGAIWDFNNVCADDPNDKSDRKFSTLAIELTDIIRCLSDDSAALDDIIDYDWEYDFSKFVYE